MQRNSLFADLYGYWEPPPGWIRTSGECPAFERRFELRHPTLGTLHFEQPAGFDAIPVHVCWVLGREADIKETSALMKAFLPSGYAVESNWKASDSEVHWSMRPLTFWELFRRYVFD